jgi:hypothetical protein
MHAYHAAISSEMHTERVEVQLHSFLTSALDGGPWPTFKLRPLYPRERTPVPTEQQAKWAPEPFRCIGKEKNLSILPGVEPQTVRPVS